MKENAAYRLEVMQKRLEDLLRLLDSWQQYVDIIYAPEIEMNFMKVLKDQGQYSLDEEDRAGQLSGAADELSFAQKMQNEDVERRLRTLFSKQEEDELDRDQKSVSKEVDDAYMSVNEPMTTDTPLTSEMEDSEMKRSI